MSKHLIILTMVLIIFSAKDASCCLTIQNENRQLDQLIDSVNRCHCRSAYRGINRLGRHADGEFAEYFGNQVVNLLQSDSTHGTFVTYLLYSPRDQRRHIDMAIAYEIYIVAGNNYAEYLKGMIDRFCVSVNASKRKVLFNRYRKLVSKLPNKQP